MRLFCDEMLAGLALWLRAAGYDAALPNRGESDGSLLARAAAMDRTILTRDAAMAGRRLAAGRVMVLGGDRLPAWAAQVTSALGIDWMAAPFSRCLDCNLPLAAHPLGGAAMPARVRETGGPVTCCPGCGKAYWRGSHVHRMEARLRDWRAGRFR